MKGIIVDINRNKEFEAPVLTDIRTCWDKIKPGIQEILDNSPKLTYLPEDVYSECVNSRAMLFTSSIGFVVMHVETDPFTRDKTLVVWIGYVYTTGQNNWLDHIDWFETIALECGCKYLEARSDVPQLDHYFTSTGWELETKVFIREIDNGQQK